MFYFIMAVVTDDVAAGEEYLPTIPTSAGALILGSNISMCEGPPWRKRSTTDLPVTGRPEP